ncbi:MAG: PEP-CTERM sorting domain-containing protein [Planctomycetes bacterium]|nr:PEP-CTERM sorting domain-containing protein [Planctomycetota bacterium]
MFDTGGYNDAAPQGVAAVPEPTSAAAVAVAGLIVLAVARRRSGSPIA